MFSLILRDFVLYFFIFADTSVSENGISVSSIPISASVSALWISVVPVSVRIYQYLLDPYL